MFCPMCGAKLSDDARFCTECGTPLSGLKGDADAREQPVASGSVPEPRVSMKPTVPAEPVTSVEPVQAPEPQQPRHSNMMSFLMERRQIGNRLVPTFAIIIASIIAAIGVAYAAFMVYRNVIEPSMRQPAAQVQTIKGTKKKSAKKVETKQEKQKDEASDQQEEQSHQPSQNDQAHTAYDDVLKQYREAFANGDYDDCQINDSSSDESQMEYFTDVQANSKYPLVNDMVASSTGMYSSGTDGDNSSYLYLDLNGDGVDELLLKNDYFVYAVYGYVDGQVKGLLQGWERNSYQLVSGGMIMMTSSGGWATNITTVNRYVSNGSFDIVDEVDEDIDGEQIVAKRVKDGQTLSEVTDPASGNAVNGGKLFDQLKAEYPEDTSVVWQPLNS